MNLFLSLFPYHYKWRLEHAQCLCQSQIHIIPELWQAFIVVIFGVIRFAPCLPGEQYSLLHFDISTDGAISSHYLVTDGAISPHYNVDVLSAQPFLPFIHLKTEHGGIAALHSALVYTQNLTKQILAMALS
jgi:hypothetical protein